MECDKCGLSVTKDKILCSGFCDGMFHYSCAGIDRVAYNQCIKCPSILWFCEECKNLLTNKSFRKWFVNSKVQESFLQLTLDKLSAEVSSIKELIKNDNAVKEVVPISTSSAVVLSTKELPHCIDSTTSTYASILAPSRTAVSTSVLLPKSTSASSGISSKSATSAVTTSVLTNLSATVSSTRASSSDTGKIKAASCGTESLTSEMSEMSNFGLNILPAKSANKKQAATIFGTSSLPDIQIKTVAPKFWIHVSRFSPVTTEEDILGLANKCLGTNLYKVGKLVPKSKAIQELDYVCFKLGINDDLKDKALNAKTWPIGVIIRPFYNRNFQPGASKVKLRIPAVVVNPSVI